MTRFARAKGSKSSNEKVPEEATPWSELKKGMVMKQEPLTEETKKYVSDLKSKVDDNKSVEWVSFDDEDDSLNILKKHLEKRKKAKANCDDDNDNDVVQEGKQTVKDRKRKKGENVESHVQKKKKKGEVDCQDESQSVETLKKEGKSKKKMKQNAAAEERSEPEIVKKRKKVDVSVAEDDINEKKKKKKKNLSPEASNSGETNEGVKEKVPKKKKKLNKKGAEENTKMLMKTKKKLDKEGLKEKPEMSKKKKKLKKEGADSLEGNKEKTGEQSKKKKMKTFAGDKSLKKKSNIDNESQSINPKLLKKVQKHKNKPNDDKLTINIGGEMVNIVKFQGFYVTEEDGERLKELRKKMIKEGIPQTQIEGAIKLERRRCEKALSRMRKNVCFQCRKPGHLLSQCPNIQESVDTATGVCYKCGSTEHKAFTCKVTKGQKFPFAECFICKEKGHIARECPDNPRGLYPKGGCCKICGDVTHLKKDCPKMISQTEERTIKLGVVDDRNLEGLDDGNNKSFVGNDKKQRKRPVRF